MQYPGAMNKEERIIAQNPDAPITVATLRHDFEALGVRPGMTLILHSSLRTLGGWICGGPVAVILALEDLLGSEGTLVMPTHSGDLSDPTQWRNPPVPESWWPIIKETMPAFEPELTPTREMGAIPETFRKQRGVLRSRHPQVSFAAWGKHATTITAEHPLDYGLGEDSPTARVYQLDGMVLLLGVGHGNNTSLHLAEYRADYPAKQEKTNGAPMLVDGERRWIPLRDIDIDDGDFEQIGAAFDAATNLSSHGRVSAAVAQLVPQRPLVDFAVRWIEQHRTG